MLSFVLNYFKENKKLYLCIVIFVVFISGIQHWSFILESVLPRLLCDLGYVISLIVLLSFGIYFIKLSDSKSNQRITEYMERQKFKKIINYHSVLEIHFRQTYFKAVGDIKSIEIKNLSEHTKKKCFGFIYFVDVNNCRYRTIPIDFINLGKNQSIKIDKKLIEKEIFFDCAFFELDVQDFEVAGCVVEKEKVRSNRSVPTYYMFLNNEQFRDYSICGKLKVAYNLVWIKEKKRYFFLWIKHCLGRRGWYKTSDFKRDFRMFIERIFRTFIAITVVLVIFVVLGWFVFSIVRCCILLYDVMHLLANMPS